MSYGWQYAFRIYPEHTHTHILQFVGNIRLHVHVSACLHTIFLSVSFSVRPRFTTKNACYFGGEQNLFVKL